MIKFNLNSIPVYTVISTIIFGTVLIVLTLKSVYIYNEAIDELHIKVEDSAKSSMERLSKNVVPFIIGYSPSEYEELIINEMKSNPFLLAVEINDLNMGEIINEPYKVGKIYDGTNIVKLNKKSIKHLEHKISTFTKEIKVEGSIIAIITVFSYINESEHITFYVLINDFIDILFVLFFIAIALHISIKVFVVKPLSHFLDRIESVDLYGDIKEIENEAEFLKEFILINDAFNTTLESLINSKKESEAKSENLSYLASHDTLTRLPNRLLLSDRVKVAIKKSERHNDIFALMYIDLDHFKEINDSYGHKLGDKILVEVANRINNLKRNYDTLSRIGGDEFVILAEELETRDDSESIANKVLNELSKPFLVDDTTFHLGCSIGISFYPHNAIDYDELLKQADTAMYVSKTSGRNKYTFFDDSMTIDLIDKVTIENQLRDAIKNDEIIPYFQPQVDSKTGDIVSAEALVRWQPLKGQLVSPGAFLPIALQSSLIEDIDWIVIKKVMRFMSNLKNNGYRLEKIAINVTEKELYDKEFLNKFQTLLKEENCDPTWIELEITEDNLMTNMYEIVDTMKKLENIGVKFALDDFGTGYSSLSYLKKLPIDVLKIDKSFVDGLPEDDDDIMISKSIISLAKNLKLKIIAEGVETQEQYDFLKEHGADYIQGYFKYKPMSGEDFIKTLKSQH